VSAPLRSPLLAAVPGLVPGHSPRSHGSLGRGETARRDAFLSLLGAPPAAIVVPHQVHGSRVVRVGQDDVGRGRDGRPALDACDGVATTERGPVLFGQGADCPLVLLAEQNARFVAVVHSGWRGTVARIAARAVDLAQDCTFQPAELVAAVFPGIGPCCFEVGPEVVTAFRDGFGRAAGAWVAPPRAGAAADRSRLDLAAAIAHTLMESGLDERAIDRVPGCTRCDDRLWSHRGSRGGTERHALVAFRS
jgi:YfiH family protein